MAPTPASPPCHALVLDVGGSHVASAVVHLEQRCLLPHSLHTLAIHPQATGAQLLDTWSQAALLAWNAAGQPALTHLGVAMPGPFDYQRGVSLLQHKFADLYQQPVGPGLQQRLAIPGLTLRFGNDASLFTLGEVWAGAAVGYTRVMGITLGTGLGGGFVDHGQVLYHHPQIPPEGAIWNLPYRQGIAEDWVAGPALTRQFAQQTGQELPPVEIAALAQNGHPKALETLATLGYHLGQILRPWIERFRPDCLVVGGNVARAWPYFCQPLLQILAPLTQVKVSLLLTQANLLGAAALQVSKERP